MDDLKLIKIAAAAADDKKAKNILVLDLRGKSDICDYQLICSGDNERQTRAIADAVDESLKAKAGLRPMAIEGKTGGHWIVLDYGGLAVHVFFEALRGYYALEKLWPDTKVLDWKEL